MSLRTFLFGEPVRQTQQQNLSREVEGILLALGRSIRKPHATITGSLRTLEFFAEEDREKTLVAIATLVLYNPDVVGNTLGAFNLIMSRESEWSHLITKGTAIACVFLDATELVRVLSRALTIHPEETEELSLALDWVLMPSEQRQSLQNPFRCLTA